MEVLEIAHRGMEQQLAWLAGLIDGEGSFYIATQNGKYRSARFKLKMRDEDIVRTAKHMFEQMGVGELHLRYVRRGDVRMKDDGTPGKPASPQWAIETGKAETVENIIFLLYRLFGAKKKEDCDRVIALIDEKRKARESG